MINRTITEEKALQKLSVLCAKGEHSTGEADTKMRNWGLNAEARARVIAKLVNAKFIDDRRFTSFFIHDKIKFNHWGRRKIEVALRQKGIDSSIISESLDEVPTDEYLEILRPMIRTKMETVKGDSDYERAMKTIKWAMGRGFTIDIIRECIDNAEEYAEETDD